MTTSTFVAQEVQPRTWSIIHWSAASTSVPPPPKSCAGPASAGETSAALPVRYLVTLACASAAGQRSASRSSAPPQTFILERPFMVSLPRLSVYVLSGKVLKRGGGVLPEA